MFRLLGSALALQSPLTISDTVGTYTWTPIFQSPNMEPNPTQTVSQRTDTVSPTEMLERRLTAPTESEELGVATLSRQISLIHVCLCIKI